jgi:hypothetical protein
LDTVKPIETINPVTKKLDTLDSYSFRLPNLEVESSYYADCFSAVLDLKSNDVLATKGELLIQAFLARDAEIVSSTLSEFFSAITFYQKPDAEKDFHSLTQMLLLGMGFKVRSETSGSLGRSDLIVELPGQIFVVIELRYRQNPQTLSSAEENKILGNFAIKSLPMEVVNENLAQIALNKLDAIEIHQILSKLGKNKNNEDKKNELLAQAALKLLQKSDTDQALAKLAREKLPRDEIEKILLSAPSKSSLSAERIDGILAKAAQEALTDIAAKNYPGPFRLETKEFIDLGLAIYGVGSQVKAIFSPSLK